MADQSTTATKTYRGNCHCGANIYEAQLPVDLKVSGCNCSLCFKKSGIWAIVPTPSSDLVWVKGGPSATLAEPNSADGPMSSYTFGSKSFHHKFCTTCGDALMFAGYMGPADETKDPFMGVNARTFQHGLIKDPWVLAKDGELGVYDGAALGGKYEAPVFDGPEPEIEAKEGSKLYTGSCHCGAVRVALRVDTRLDDGNYDAHPVYECNCSGCVRPGMAMLYPEGSRLSIVAAGTEKDPKEGESAAATPAIRGYAYGQLPFWERYFCTTCGVALGRRPGPAQPLSREVEAALPDMAKKWTTEIQHLRPVNLRVMDRVDGEERRVDLAGLKTTHVPGYDFIQPAYVNP